MTRAPSASWPRSSSLMTPTPSTKRGALLPRAGGFFACFSGVTQLSPRGGAIKSNSKFSSSRSPTTRQDQTVPQLRHRNRGGTGQERTHGPGDRQVPGTVLLRTGGTKQADQIIDDWANLVNKVITTSDVKRKKHCYLPDRQEDFYKFKHVSHEEFEKSCNSLTSSSSNLSTEPSECSDSSPTANTVPVR